MPPEVEAISQLRQGEGEDLELLRRPEDLDTEAEGEEEETEGRSGGGDGRQTWDEGEPQDGGLTEGTIPQADGNRGTGEAPTKVVGENGEKDEPRLRRLTAETMPVDLGKLMKQKLRRPVKEGEPKPKEVGVAVDGDEEDGSEETKPKTMGRPLRIPEYKGDGHTRIRITRENWLVLTSLMVERGTDSIVEVVNWLIEDYAKRPRDLSELRAMLDYIGEQNLVLWQALDDTARYEEMLLEIMRTVGLENAVLKG